MKLKNKKTAVAALAVGLAAAFFTGKYGIPQSEAYGCRNADLASITDQSFLPDARTATAGGEEKRVCLTFDDGPSENTLKILEILKNEQVPATFFVISADNNKEYLPLVKEELAQGMQIGLHSASHDYCKIYANTDAYWADIEDLKNALEPYMDVSEIDCLRFPGGSTNTVCRKYGGCGIMKELKQQAVEKGYHVVDWNVCADDAAGGHPSAHRVYQNTIEDVENGQNTCVVLMHDTKATGTTVEALPDIIAWFREKGFTFCTVDALYEPAAPEPAATPAA